jgi:hypothetical protein
MLDDAGYPKTPPSRRATPTGRLPGDLPPVSPPPAGDATQAVAAPGTSYPKQ